MWRVFWWRRGRRLVCIVLNWILKKFFIFIFLFLGEDGVVLIWFVDGCSGFEDADGGIEGRG